MSSSAPEFDSSAGIEQAPRRGRRATTSEILRSDCDALRGSFGFYRAMWTSAGQNVQRQAHKLTAPVLAMGGAESSRDTIGTIMMEVAENVQTVVVPGAAHWVAEQAPEPIVTTLEAFLNVRLGSTSANIVDDCGRVPP